MKAQKAHLLEAKLFNSVSCCNKRKLTVTETADSFLVKFHITAACYYNRKMAGTETAETFPIKFHNTAECY